MPQSASTRLVQLIHPDEGRRAALVYENELHLLATYRSVCSFAMAALETGWKLRDLLSTDLSGIVLDYTEVHALRTPWRFLPAFDDAEQPARCLVSVLEPNGGWQCVGSADLLRAHGEAVSGSLRVPEVAAAYLIGKDGLPRRVGVAPGAGLAIGPELILDTDMARIDGEFSVQRDGREVAAGAFSGGDAPLSLVLASVEPDHFKRAGHRRPGDSHVHFFGARVFGGTTSPVLREGDETEVRMRGFGFPLRSAVRVQEPAALVAVPL